MLTLLVGRQEQYPLCKNSCSNNGSPLVAFGGPGPTWSNLPKTGRLNKIGNSLLPLLYGY